MKIFRLPDLGEGLQEAELVEWHVKAGQQVAIDQPLLSVETAKAVVEIPSPQAGRIERLFASAGEIIRIGGPLVSFDGPRDDDADAGTVVGSVAAGAHVLREAPVAIGAAAGAIRATPAVRALARKLDVDLTIVTPSGPDGLILASDVERVARILAEAGPAEPLRGFRRAMAQNMALAQAEVAAATVMDDADIEAWPAETDTTIRLIRALVAGCRAEPSLNAWFEGHSLERRVLKKIDLGIAVDLPEGLFVPVLRDVANRDAADLRQALDRMRAGAAARTIPPEELRGATITLSNFGMIAGKYAAPIVLPPTVAILGAGRVRREVAAVDGAPAVRSRKMKGALEGGFDLRA
ncbi:MAG: 2-oxo acid dehydrogenase subunit E2 [Methylocystis sp.]|nr:2-oxo acid dehydrogenase subunit E2 [Methylocystis sp.]